MFLEFKTIDEQLDYFASLIMKNKKLMDVLDYVSRLGLPNYYIASGSVFQTIWNLLDDRDANYNIKDIDVVYYNSDNLSVDEDIRYYELIKTYCESKGYNYGVDVSNEARMHIWKREHDGLDVSPYKSVEDAIGKWMATVNAIGITKRDGKLLVYAPYGLSDIFSKTIRPIKHVYSSKKLFYDKVDSWSSRFDNLNVIEW